jgi:hypothetical protein
MKGCLFLRQQVAATCKVVYNGGQKIYAESNKG